MNKKYERYIEYIVNDIQPPYFKNMREMYGLSEKEYELVLSKVFNQPVTIEGNRFYDNNGNVIYHENSNGFWDRYEYNDQGKRTYYEDSDGFWYKKEYDDQRNLVYYGDSTGYIVDRRYE